MRGEAYTLPQGPGLSEGGDPAGFFALGEGSAGRAALGPLALVSTSHYTRVRRTVTGLLEPADESQFPHTWEFSKQLLNSCLFGMGYGESIYTMEIGRHYKSGLFPSGGLP